ncbi:MAG: type I glyceraldehyde-3-phosphate dehydrogenase [Acidimicrobiia bacterium]|nr:type I glyceraldehyde-3-phosphate dehydrogenase [Acidimicrobiia bacterium]MCL4292919.1 type I glyceraldehyde-3-phosphate dehydrogenase [Acidimicrobiia bacterium]
MTVRVGINGFGRIGRSFLRALLARGGDAGVELVAVNDPMGDNHTMAFLLAHDSVGGVLPNEVKETANGFSVDGREIRKLDTMDPAEIPWGDHGVDVVIESTGLFTAREKAAGHLAGGARKVVISAPSGDADVTVCIGVNDHVYDPVEHNVISNASCTTNCIAPLAKVLDDRFGIEQGLMTTVHAYTSDQALQDMAKPSRKGKPDLRRMRAAALSIIPSSTGAARAIGQVLPALNGKLDGTALRVPTPTGSITDLSANLRTEATTEEVNAAYAEAAAATSYKGVLEYSADPLVSADIVGNPSSCIFSALDTMANGKMVKVLGWYDNEWGYSNRLVDLVAFVAA